ncbi:hypothetical protein JXJ21_05595 [candidate division KSB1 bacterium]|nr:hypothetical protein [candidate division KSB1 bacterium]
MMEEETVLQQLEAILKELSIALRYEKGRFQGGLCRLHGEEVFILNSKLSVDRKIRIIAKELSLLNLENVYILPAIREIIEEMQDESDLVTA